jgi:hypothetical protein
MAGRIGMTIYFGLGFAVQLKEEERLNALILENIEKVRVDG